MDFVRYSETMSSSETENSEKCEKSLKSKRFIQKTIRELRQLEGDKLFQYIERLHNLLNRNERKLKKYKAKTKKLVSFTLEIRKAFLDFVL